ncbi:MAG: class I SAM-dependent methyltransferase [Anaerolineae bacterium]|nr:class I SAM-dependent methyltransferase [Anaerolineae bacterium]
MLNQDDLTANQKTHRRFLEQATWTRAARDYVLKNVGCVPGARLLEVGCGEGVISAELAGRGAAVHGLDLRLNAIKFARQTYARTFQGVTADGLALPYPDDCFDGVFCHFLLLWLPDPLAGLLEMKRVLRPGGWLAVLAEPDYDGRIDYPPELAEIGRWQAKALARQGADVALGRKLSGLLHKAGLAQVKTALLGGEWQASPSQESWQNEWDTLTADLAGWVTDEELARLKNRDALAWNNGQRVLYVPTFFGWGWKS